MRKINKIIIHYPGHHNSENDSIEFIDRVHLERGWHGCGYHAYMNGDAEIFQGRPDRKIGAHCRNHNDDSLGICVFHKGFLTLDQARNLRKWVLEKMQAYNLKPRDVYPHNYFDKGGICPDFDIDDILWINPVL